MVFCETDCIKPSTVSARPGLVWLEFRLGSGSFFSENESLGSASTTKSLDSAS